MFHIEDTTKIRDAEESDDCLLILDGTARLDYFDEVPQFEEVNGHGRLRALLARIFG